VKTDPRYGSEKLNKSDIQALRTQAESDLRALRQSQCEERFPGLSGLISKAPDNSPLRGVALDPSGVVDGLRGLFRGRGDDYPSVEDTLNQLDKTTELLGRQAWNLDSLKDLSRELDGHIGLLKQVGDDVLTLRHEREMRLFDLVDQREGIESQLQEARLGVSQSQPGNDQRVRELEANLGMLDSMIESAKQDVALYRALDEELDHQGKLLEAKQLYVDEMRLSNPLTDRSVKHSNLVWHEAGKILLDQLRQSVEQGQPPLTQEQKDALARVQSEWLGRCQESARAYEDSSDVETLQSIPVPGKDNKETHPIVQGKRDTLQALHDRLSQAGVPKDMLKLMFSDLSLQHAERRALSGIDTWQPVNRDMVVMRDGVMRVYKSKIVPAQFINRQLGVDLGEGRVGGTSAGVKDSLQHARNLKVSTLSDSNGKVMSTVVGNGALDMWGVEDEKLRQESNKQGAKEVLEVALSSNTRLRKGLSDPQRDPNAPPPRIVHVSVNLISPDSVRDILGVKDYQERTYTFNQFKAFEENSGTSQKLRLFDPATRRPDQQRQCGCARIRSHGAAGQGRAQDGPGPGPAGLHLQRRAARRTAAGQEAEAGWRRAGAVRHPAQRARGLRDQRLPGHSHRVRHPCPGRSGAGLKRRADNATAKRHDVRGCRAFFWFIEHYRGRRRGF